MLKTDLSFIRDGCTEIISKNIVLPCIANTTLSCRHCLAGTEMFERLIKQMAQREGATEQLRAVNQIIRICKINNIRNQATKVVYDEIIYV